MCGSRLRHYAHNFAVKGDSGTAKLQGDRRQRQARRAQHERRFDGVCLFVLVCVCVWWFCIATALPSSTHFMLSQVSVASGTNQGSQLVRVCIDVVMALPSSTHLVLSQVSSASGKGKGSRGNEVTSQCAKPNDLSNVFGLVNVVEAGGNISKEMWSACALHFAADLENPGHLEVRSLLIQFAEKINKPPKGWSLLDSIDEGRARGPIADAGGDENVFARWLVYMYTPQTYADHYCTVLAAMSMQRQVRVYSLDPITGSPRNSPVDKAAREPSAICLFLDKLHYFLLIPDHEMHKLPLEKRPPPACMYNTPDGERFQVFGLNPDGNCFFRAIDLWRRLFSIGIQDSMTQFWFNGPTEGIQAGRAELFLSNSSDIVLNGHSSKRVLTPGDTVHDPNGVPGQHTFFAGHALTEGWKRYAILMTCQFKLMDLNDLQHATTSAAPKTTADTNTIDLTGNQNWSWQEASCASDYSTTALLTTCGRAFRNH